MKWVTLIIFLAAIVPVRGWLRRDPNAIPRALVLIGFLPWILDLHLQVAVISDVNWIGHANGVEFGVLDALTLALYISLPRVGHALPFRISMLLYFSAVLLSVFQARYAWIAAVYYLAQLARMFLVYAAVTRVCVLDSRAISALMTGMVAGLLFETVVVIFQRFALGILQASGTTSHQNKLGMMCQFVVFPLFALLLNRQRGWLPIAATLAGLVIQVLTVSRATIGLSAFGYVAVYLLSIARQWTSRKAQVLLISLAAAAGFAPIVMSSLESRLEAEHVMWGDYDERTALKTMAAMILSDYPLGVGANNFVPVAVVEGYSERAGVAPTSRIALVHNVYWLVAAETGYLGFATFVLLLMRPMIVAFLCGWRYRKDVRGDLLLGFGVALLTIYLHSFVEWVLITRELEYMLALTFGIISGLAQQLGYWRKPATSIASGSQLGIENLRLRRRQNTLEFEDKSAFIVREGRLR